MNSHTIGRPLPLYRPWPRRLLEDLGGALGRAWQGLRAAREARLDDDALAGIDPATLADIGAPQRVQERARLLRERQAFERDLMRIGSEGGSTRYF